MRRGILILLIIFAIGSNNCELFDDDNPYTGITETTIIEIDELQDPEENIISVDEDDWNVEYNPSLPDYYTNNDSNSIEHFLPLLNKIGPAFPNPTHDSTYICFENPKRGFTEIYIKDKDKNKIKTLVSDTLCAGYYKVYWYLDDNHGNKVDDGIYRCIYRFELIRYENDVRIVHKVSGHGDIKVE